MKRLILVIAAVLIASTAHAELRAARPPVAVAGGGVGYFTFTASRPGEIPSAVLMYSGDGASFWVRRSSGAGTFEAVPLKVPDNQPLTMPTPAPYNNAGTYTVIFEVNATAVTDSVYAIGLDR